MRTWRMVGLAIFGIVVLLGTAGLAGMGPSTTSSAPVRAAISYNVGTAAEFHAPISTIATAAVNHGTPAFQGGAAQGVVPQVGAGMTSIPVNAVRFTTDLSYIPQSETSVYVDPANVNRVVGGVNDARYFFCPALPPSQCPSGYTSSVTGFTVSSDGGRTILKSDDLPGLNETVTNATGITHTEFMASWGDPSVAAGVRGEFFFATLLISTAAGAASNGFSNANGIELSVSTGNLFATGVSCTTPPGDPAHNACWSQTMVTGNLTDRAGTFEDKVLTSVDRDATSPYYGDAYVSWDHFTPRGTSQGWVARCTPALLCTMIAGGFPPASPPPVSGADLFVAFTTPTVGKDGAAHFTWCDYGTATTLGPIYCRERSTAANGGAFEASNHTVLSFDGAGTMLPGDLGLVGYATEQFRTASYPVLAVDTSTASNNLYFTIEVCTSGTYYDFNPTAGPGNCGGSSVLFSRSTNGGLTWSAPVTLSASGLNIQPWVTTDPLNGYVVVAYYSTQFDPFNHRTDVVASVSSDQGLTFGQVRVTNVSDEPNADPVMFNYLALGGFGGSFVVPQFGDYMQVYALGGVMWIAFTGNYASELGTFQADPWLAIYPERSPLSVSASATPNPSDPGIGVTFTAAVTNAVEPTSYAWSFGDGSKGSGASTIVHAYSAVGTYTAMVWANDSAARSATSQVTVTVLRGLVASQAVTPTTTDAGVNLTFNATAFGGTGTYTFAWTFGDGMSSSLQGGTHAYAAAGTYTVNAWVNDTGGGSVKYTTSVTVNSRPSATATASVSATDVGQAVSFSGHGTGGTAPYVYAWDFADGSGTAGPTASHAFATPGSYAATLAVTDSVGSRAAYRLAAVVVNALPAAKASASTSAPLVGDTVTFTGSVAGGTSAFTYSWSFGDGATSASQNPTHAYASPGTYTVTLVVHDAAGSASTATLSVVVSPSTVTTTTAIIGMSVAFIVGLILAAVAMLFLARRRTRADQVPPSPPGGPQGGAPPPPP